MGEKKSIVVESGLSALSDQKLFNELVEQLEKDILLSGLEVDSLIKENPDNYLNSLILFLENRLKSDPEKLRALCYRIDVKEKDIISLFHEAESNENLLIEFSKTLIIRELQKINNRKKYE